MGTVRAFLLPLCAALSLSSCVTFTKPLPQDGKVDDSLGYLYGRFALTNTGGFGNLTLGLVAAGPAGDVTIKFTKAKDVTVVPVAPGTYHLEKIVFVHALAEKGGEKPIGADLSSAFRVEPGKAYYIGDYDAEAGVRGGYPTSIQSWQLKSVRDLHAPTTRDLLAKFPEFHDVVAENAMKSWATP